MPYKRELDHRNCNAASMRRRRLFDAAVLAGHPKAADALRHLALADPLRPADDLRDEILALPDREAKLARKAEYVALLAHCQTAKPDKAHMAQYWRLRAEVVAEMEAAGAAR